jgi:cell division septal protein FtsQ
MSRFKTPPFEIYELKRARRRNGVAAAIVVLMVAAFVGVGLVVMLGLPPLPQLIHPAPGPTKAR